MSQRLATVFGGSGFVGRHIVEHLARDGWRVRVAVRDPVGAEFLKPAGDVGQIVPVFADIGNEVSVGAAIDGAGLVVNSVGILTERGRATYKAIHVEGAERVARAAAQKGAATLVHVSAIGADPASPAAYARSKAEGEARVRAAFPAATILRPSVVFGPGDGFFTLFDRMARLSPVMPVFVAGGLKLRHCGPLPCGLDLFGDKGPLLQPVYVGDVAKAVLAAIHAGEARGKIYELGGPRVMSLKDIVTLVLATGGRKRALLPVPMGVARLQAALMRVLPNPPLTPDQVRMLAIPNVVGEGAAGFDALGIVPTAAEVILPTYLGRGASS